MHDVLDNFKSSTQSTPVGSAMSGFFTVSLQGTCPVWSFHVPYLEADATIDTLCTNVGQTILFAIKGVLLVVAGFVAFKVAAL